MGNARQSAYFYRNAFGFDVIAYAGLETRTRHEAGYVLRQGDITFVLASPLGPDHPESQRIITHGDGVQDIALEVDDVRTAYETACRRGATGVAPPTLLEDEHGVYEFATIRAYGDTTHTFVNRDRYRGVFAPGYKPLDPDRYSPRTFQPDRPQGHRPHRRQRRGRQDGRVGALLRERARLHAAGPLRRQGHQHGVLGADVEGGAGRQRPDQVPDQRAGQAAAGGRRSRNT